MMRIIVLPFLISLFATAVLAHEPQVPTSIEHYTPKQVCTHVYVIEGPQALPSPATRGFMNNPGVILSQHGVIIVDPGSSMEIGRQLLKKIRSISKQPVIAVFNTHVHGDHWLGNQAIREAYPRVPIYAHERMIQRVLAGEGEDWIKRFNDMTKGASAGTKAVAPNIGLKGGETLELDGLKLKIHHTGHAHTDHDIMIEVVDDKCLFFGDIVASRRVPNSDVPQDANFKGTIKAIKTLLTGNLKVFIPGHGPSGGREVPEASLDFLQILLAEVTRYYKQGLEAYEMKDKVEKALWKYRNWTNFSELGRVISFVYQEVERDNFQE